MSALDFDRFEAITFDCYGTIVDWESGILAALERLVGDRARVIPPPEQLLELFGRLEADAEHGPFRRYRDVLTDVAHGFAVELGIERDEARAAAFAASVAEWPPFADSVAALRALGSRYRLAIVSNIDDDLFAATSTRLGVDFAEVVTAQQVESYKPAPAHFHEVLRRLDLPIDRVLHVAQSLYHDIAPAKALGFTCVWVNRRSGRDGSGATRPAVAAPDLELPDLGSLATMSGSARARPSG